MSSMAPPEPEKRESEKKPTVTPTAAAVLPSGELVEMVYDPAGRKTQFVCGSGEEWRYEESAANGIVETLKKLFDNAWGIRLEYILRNALLLLLEQPDAT